MVVFFQQGMTLSEWGAVLEELKVYKKGQAAGAVAGDDQGEGEVRISPDIHRCFDIYIWMFRCMPISMFLYTMFRCISVGVSIYIYIDVSIFTDNDESTFLCIYRLNMVHLDALCFDRWP